jgi:hypothetical protein
MTLHFSRTRTKSEGLGLERVGEFPPVSLTGGYQAASGWLAYASSYSHGLM